MIGNNTSSDFHFEDLGDTTFSGQLSWEQFIQFEGQMQAPGSPGAQYSEIMFEKPQEELESMDVEETICSSDNFYGKNFGEGFDFSQQSSPQMQGAVQTPEDNPQIFRENEECSRCHSETDEEEVRSISTTMDSNHQSFFEGDNSSYTNETPFLDQSFDLENEIRNKAFEFFQSRPDEEKTYLNQVMPHLISSVKEIYQNNPLPLTQEVVTTIMKELLYGRELMIGAERQALRQIVEKEIDETRAWRPNAMVTEDELVMQRRKEKKAAKGNKNGSTVNHLNENYVSNIFQFAKRNYPNDKEIQKIGNERNVSALNFRNMMAPKLTDNVMTRKAKTRIVEGGQELVGNIEYWMKDGYFEQCADREKYIYHKQKALRDLALGGKY